MLAGQQAELQTNGIIAEVQRRVDRMFTAEIGRLQALSKINKNIRSQELEYFIGHRAILANIIGSARLRLDSLRVIVAT